MLAIPERATGRKHIVFDQERLCRMLHSISGHAEIARVDLRRCGEDSKELLENFAELHRCLTAQFGEEAAGLFKEAVCRCPRLAVATDSLLRDHRRLLHSLEMLVQRTNESLKEGRLPRTFDQRLAVLSRRIGLHQAKKEHVLSTGLGAEWSNLVRAT